MVAPPTQMFYSLAALLAVAPVAHAFACTPTSTTCYSDAAGPRALNISLYSRASTSASSCATACGASGYSLAGVTGHATPAPFFYCYCGSGIVPGAATAPEGQCSVPCPLNASQSCGADYRLAVYRFACDGPIPKPLAPGPACSQPETRGLPFCNTALPLPTRVSDLVGRLALEEIGPQLTARNAPAIPRLGINAFYWGVNNVHAITNSPPSGLLCLPGASEKCVTVWPSGPALGQVSTPPSTA